MGAPCIPDDLYESPDGKLLARPMDVQPIYRIAGHILVANGGGRILVMRRNARLPWELPGGMFDPLRGASGLMEACIVSTGYRFQISSSERVLYTSERKQYFSDDHTWCRQTIHVYRGLIMSRKQDLGIKIELGRYQTEWLTPRELKRSNVHPAFWPYLRTIVRNGKKAA